MLKEFATLSKYFQQADRERFIKQTNIWDNNKILQNKEPNVDGKRWSHDRMIHHINFDILLIGGGCQVIANLKCMTICFGTTENSVPTSPFLGNIALQKPVNLATKFAIEKNSIIFETKFLDEILQFQNLRPNLNRCSQIYILRST